MRYILSLFLIALISSSEIINKADEIKEFAQHENVDLKILFRIISLINKISFAGIALCIKARAFINKTKILKYIKGNIGAGSKIFKGERNLLLQKSKIFFVTKKIFNKGLIIYNKYSEIIKNPRINRENINAIDKVEQNKIYQTYQKIRDTFNEAKETYDKLKNYYEKTQDIYNKNFKQVKTPEEQHKEYQRLEQIRTQEYQAQQQILNISEKKRQARLMQQKLQQEQKNQAFKRYEQLKNNITMTLATKQTEINNLLDYMLNKGFIDPFQKQQMSNILQSKPGK